MVHGNDDVTAYSLVVPGRAVYITATAIESFGRHFHVTEIAHIPSEALPGVEVEPR